MRHDVAARILGPKAARGTTGPGVWRYKPNRVRAIKDLMASLGKQPRDMKARDFCDNGLGAILHVKPIYELLNEAGFEVHPWELCKVPHGFWDDPKNRGNAVRWLLVLTGKGPFDLRMHHLERNCLFGLWQFQRKLLRSQGSSASTAETMFELLKAAGLGEAVGGLEGLERAWSKAQEDRRKAYKERSKARCRIWAKRILEDVPDEKRAKKIVDLTCRSCQKQPSDLTYEDFVKAGQMNGIRAVGGKRKLLALAGIRVPPWEMKKAPRGLWNDTKTRSEAIRMLIEVTGKDPYKLTRKDLLTHGMAGLARFDMRQLLKDAGYPALRPFSTNRRAQWTSKDDRVLAVRWLARTTGKKGIDLNKADFASNGLWTLWGFYHPQSCRAVPKGELLDFGQGWLLEYKNPAHRAAAEAGLLDKQDDKNAKVRYPPSKFGSKQARVSFIRKAVDGCNKRPEDLRLQDLKRSGLTHLMGRYYDNDVLKALEDAGYDIDPGAIVPVHKPGTWKDPKNRSQAVRQFVISSGRSPEALTAVMMCKAGLGSLLVYRSFWELLHEAGYDVPPWTLARVPSGFWKERKNRGHAVRWLIDKIGIGPAKLGPKHFEDNCLFGLWQFMKKRIRSELGGKKPSSKLTLARLLEDAGLMLPARAVLLRKNTLVFYGDDTRGQKYRSG